MEGKPPSTSPVPVLDRPRSASTHDPASNGAAALLAGPMLVLASLLAVLLGAETLSQGSLRTALDLAAIGGIGLTVAVAVARFARAVFR